MFCLVEDEYINQDNTNINIHDCLTESDINIMFKDALKHNRRFQSSVYRICQNIKLNDYKNKTIDEVIDMINNKSKYYKGIGALSIYDISMSICRYYKLKLKKIYIIVQCKTGNTKGPYNAIIELGLESELKFNRIIGTREKLKLYTIEFDKVLERCSSDEFKELKKYIDEQDGDKCETFLCLWYNNHKKTE